MYFHKFFLILFTFSMKTEHSYANSSGHITNFFSSKQDEEERFVKLAVHNNGNWVYVVSTTHLYQLSADLQTKIASFKWNHSINYFNENTVLELDYQNQQLISCSAWPYVCYAHNISDITQILIQYDHSYSDTNDFDQVYSFVSFITHSPLQNSSVLYYGYADYYKKKTKIGIKNLQRKSFLSDIGQIIIERVEYIYGGFIYGFNSGNFSYFLANSITVRQKSNVESFINLMASRVGYLIEIEHKSQYTKYNDILIACGDTFAQCADKCKLEPGRQWDRMLLQNAYFYTHESNSELETGSDKMEGKILFAVFELLLNWKVVGFKICKYDLNKIYPPIQKRKMLDGELIHHYVGYTIRVTAVVVTSINDHIVLFIGTNEGYLQKISIAGLHLPIAPNANNYNDIMIDDESPIRSDMLLDPEKNFLYVMSGKKLAKVKIHNCDDYNTSYSCLNEKDPYCGWCFPSNRCTLRSECNNKHNSGGWFSYDNNEYVNASSSTETKFSRTAEWNITFSLSNSHPFNNRTIICSFKFDNIIINTTTRVDDGNNINCVTPNHTDLPPTPNNEHVVEAELSLQTNDFPEFHNTLVGFFDCSTYESCTQCSNFYPCYWYLNEQQCTDRIWHSDDIELARFSKSGGDASARKIFTKLENNCPMFYNPYAEPFSHDSHIYIHADKEKEKRITLQYIMPAILINKTFTCKFDKEGIEIIGLAHLQNDIYLLYSGFFTGEMECDVTFTYVFQEPNITVDLFVLWDGSNYLQNLQNSHIILYKCANMGNKCQTCLDENYECIFNSKTGQCKHDNCSHVEFDNTNENDYWWNANDIEKCSNFTPVFPEPDSKNQTIWLTIIVVLTLTAGAIFIIFYRKFAEKSRKMQQQISKMGMEMIAMSQWVKRVVIENEIELSGNESYKLKLPNVTIVYTSIPRTMENDTMPQIEYELPLDDKWEIPRDNLVLGKCLGEGEFGRVVEGNVSGLSRQDVVTTVAVKMLKNIHSDIDMINLVTEMELMKLIGRHENVLSLLGCCTRDGPLYIITEYSPHGNLLDFLRNHPRPSKIREIASNDLPENVLITFAVQVARGMKYLASIKCIHRDLAARNILVFDNHNVKIADFGLARDIRHDYYYRQKTNGKFPVKWMAPETLVHRRYTTQSDVWSYGVLLWEIMSFGAVPYLAYDDAEKLLEDIQSGYRMKKPDGCSIMIYCLMCKCWNYLPEDRPEFSKISQELKTILGDDAIIEYPDSDCSDSNSSNSTISRHTMKNETDGLLEGTC